jgi:hypothetical protein
VIRETYVAELALRCVHEGWDFGEPAPQWMDEPLMTHAEWEALGRLVAQFEIAGR